MAASPLAVLFVLWAPCLAAYALRATLSRPVAQRAGEVFDILSWLTAGFCVLLGICCAFSTSHASSLWAPVGMLGFFGLAILGSFLWLSFQLAHRVLVAARRPLALAGLPVIEI